MTGDAITGMDNIREEILKKINHIRPLSQSASRLIGLMCDPNHTVAQITQIVETDAALTARILKVVNSAAFSLIEPTTSISRGVSFLGGKMIEGMALDFCASEIYGKSLDGYESAEGEMWSHNLRAAIAAKEIAKLAGGKVNPNMAFTGGILHDIGKAVISEFLRDSASEIVVTIDDGTSRDYLSAEEKRLGINHSVVGAEIARHWSLPDPLPEVIEYHHNPGAASAGNRPLVYAVHLGDVIAMMGGVGTGADCMQYRLDSGYGKYLDLSPDALAVVMITVQEEFAKTQSALFG